MAKEREQHKSDTEGSAIPSKGCCQPCTAEEMMLDQHVGRLNGAWDVQVAVKVDEGVKQLLRAEKHQKQSRLILCIMFLIVAVIFMLFIVIFKTLLF
jgi:hypothetical protein